MRKLTECIWYTEPVAATDRPLLAVIRGTDRTLMIDGGNSPRHAESFLDDVRRMGIPQPDYIAITHSHCDHIFGLASLKGIILANTLTRERIARLNHLDWNDRGVAERVAAGQEHEMTARMLKDEMPGDRSRFRIRLPDVVFETKLAIRMGNVTCFLERIGGDHSADSTVVHVPEQGVAFIGDCLYISNTDRATVDALFGKLLGFHADLYMDSHEELPISRKQLEQRYRELAGTRS